MAIFTVAALPLLLVLGPAAVYSAALAGGRRCSHRAGRRLDIALDLS
ncbi:hypothetical protein AB0F17_47275 [Nonomuraea sp. NPDC026600]